MPYSQSFGKFAFKVEPHRAISEPDYFIKLIAVAEKNREEEIRKVKLGFKSVEEEKDCCS